MPNTRKKLIELLRSDMNVLKAAGTSATATLRLADNLIANGVTFATDNNVGSKWISVNEMLPEKDGHYICNYHFGEYPKMTFTQVLDYYATDIVPHFQHTLGDGSMKVTHWMPLPEPPKGE